MRRFVGCLALTMAVAACGGDDGNEQLRARVAELETAVAAPIPTAVPTNVLPDRVVGVSWECESFTLEGARPSNAQGDICKVLFSPTWCGRQKDSVVPGCTYVQKVVATVVVRTAEGTSYTVRVDNPLADIALGSVWPP